MFTLIVPFTNILPDFLSRLSLPPPTFQDFFDPETNEYGCHLSIPCLDEQGVHGVHVFTGTSISSHKEAGHFASLALLHHLKKVHKFTVIDVNYKIPFGQSTSLLTQPKANLGRPSPESDDIDFESLFPCSDDLISLPFIDGSPGMNMPLYGALEARVKELEGQLEDLSSRLAQAESDLCAAKQERDSLKQAKADFSKALKNLTASDVFSEPGTSAPEQIPAERIEPKKKAEENGC
ncbi:uncharacterized protein [Euphorbia lathyris]|uniref:uncharacterized protein n=1 Tax=Euphorbia lathyris TaxID=212925 RepID=UPI0033132B88